MAFLEVKDIVKDFGGLVANSNVSFQIEEGEEIIGRLIGPTGPVRQPSLIALLDIIARIQAGLPLRGNDITGLKPFQTSRAGIGRTFQIMKVTTGMTVVENVMVGAFCRTNSRHQARENALEILVFLGMEGMSEKYINELPIAMQRKVGMARALATKPKLLMLDEVASGLNHTETDEMVVLLKRVNTEKKITLFLIEHIMEMVMAVSQRVIVLDGGVKIAEGLPGDIVKDENVIKAYLGEKYAKNH